MFLIVVRMMTTRPLKVMSRQGITRVMMGTIASTSRMVLRMTSIVAIAIDTAARTTMIRQKETAKRRTENRKIIIRKAGMMERTRKMVETMRIISIQVPMLMAMVVREMRLLTNIRMVPTFMTTITTMTKLVMKLTDRRPIQRTMITAMTMGQCRL